MIKELIAMLREKNPLPDGAVSVGTGLLLSGVATYLFLGVSSHALTDTDYASLTVMWSLLFAVGNGVMQPLEQEVARAVSDRRARGLGSAPVLGKASLIGGVFTLALLVGGALAGPLLRDRLFDGNSSLVVAFLIGLTGFAVAHLVRGTLSSHGLFRRYAVFFAADGLTRPALAGALVVLGVSDVGWYGAAAIVAPFVGASVALGHRRSEFLQAGPEASWQELTVNLGWLLLGTLSIALLLNGGTPVVEYLSADTPEADAAAATFNNGLQMARIPVFLFQAVLVALLPKLSGQLGRGDVGAFRATLVRLLVAIGVLGGLATLAIAAVGPFVIDLIFGTEEVLGVSDLAILTVACIVFITAMTIGQALIALERHVLWALGSVLGLAAFGITVALGDDLFLRVELGLLAGSTLSAVVMAVLVRTETAKRESKLTASEWAPATV